MTPSNVAPLPKVVAAWAVHGLTLTGVIWAAAALVALMQGDPKLMWLFLGISLVVDAIDGPLARKMQVSVYTPQFDGAILDIIIDYLTWSFIPGLFFFLGGMGGGVKTSFLGFVVIAVSSMFCYANVRMKTAENYFMGFPAAWNVVVIYLWLLMLPVWVNWLVVILFALLTVAPLTFVHPFRVRRMRVYTVTATALWLVATGLLVLVYPAQLRIVEIVWWLSGAWILIAGAAGTYYLGRRRTGKPKAGGRRGSEQATPTATHLKQ